MDLYTGVSLLLPQDDDHVCNRLMHVDGDMADFSAVVFSTLTTEAQVKQWRAVFQRNSLCDYVRHDARIAQRFDLLMKYRCKVQKCKATLHFTVPRLTRSTMSKNATVRSGYRCRIEIDFHHNHEIASPESLVRRRVDPSVREKILEAVLTRNESLQTVHQRHQEDLLREAGDDPDAVQLLLNDRNRNPSMRQIRYWIEAERQKEQQVQKSGRHQHDVMVHCPGFPSRVKAVIQEGVRSDLSPEQIKWNIHRTGIDPNHLDQTKINNLILHFKKVVAVERRKREREARESAAILSASASAAGLTGEEQPINNNGGLSGTHDFNSFLVNNATTTATLQQHEHANDQSLATDSGFGIGLDSSSFTPTALNDVDVHSASPSLGVGNGSDQQAVNEQAASIAIFNQQQLDLRDLVAASASPAVISVEESIDSLDQYNNNYNGGMKMTRVSDIVKGHRPNASAAVTIDTTDSHTPTGSNNPLVTPTTGSQAPVHQSTPVGKPGSSGTTGSDGPLMCGTCSVLIRNTTHNLAVHMRRHLQYRPYACVKCSYTGFDEEDVRRHISRAHDAVPTDVSATMAMAVRYTPQADMESQVSELIQSSRSVSAGPPSSPAQPGCVANGPIPTSSLMMDIDEGPLSPDDLLTSFVKCQLCARSVSICPEKLLQHVKGHTNFTGYMCPKCPDPAKIGTLASFSDHMRTEHADEPQKAERAIFVAEELLPRQILHLMNQAFPLSAPTGADAAKLDPATLSPGTANPSIKCAECARSVPLNSTHIEEHAAEHAGADPYRCKYCRRAFYSSMCLVGHVMTDHPTGVVSLDHVASIHDSIAVRDFVVKSFPLLAPEWLERAPADNSSADSFVGLSVKVEPRAPEDPGSLAVSGISVENQLQNGHSTGASLASGDAIECAVCASLISRNISSLLDHAKGHLGYKPLRCGHCPYRHLSQGKMRRHVRQVHPNLEFKVIYQKTPGIASQVRDMKRRCFGQAIGLTLNVSDIERLLENEESRVTASTGYSGESTSTIHEPPAKIARTESPNIATDTETARSSNGAFSQEQSAMGTAYLLRQLVGASGSAGSPTPSNGASASRRATPSPAPSAPQRHHANSSVIIQTSSPSSHLSSSPMHGAPVIAKKKCMVCTITIANNPSSFENHACKHLDYKPYHCQYCAYQSYIRGKVTRHIQQVHHGLPVKINHELIPGIKEKIASVKYQCFPFLAPVGWVDEVQCAVAPLAKGEELHCLLCGSPVSADQGDLDEHIKIHCDPKIYYCTVCEFHSQHATATKQHVNANHADLKVTRIICCPADGPAGRDRLRDQCFGPRVEETTDPNTSGSSSAGYRIYTSATVTPPASRPDPDVVPIEADDPDNELSRFDDGDDNDLLMMDDDEDEPSGTPDSVSIDMGDTQATCALCSTLIPVQSGPIGAHVRQHLPNYRPYQCAHCDFKASAETEVKEHTQTTHPASPVRVLYNPERALLSKWQAKCFPNLPNGIGVRLASSGRNVTSLNSNGSKLTCKLCSNQVADNPKSVGIHVKNHLNYKPYRCPDCNYMSCEQSKTRRHIEHVHGRSGDMLLVVNLDEDNIKTKITDMRMGCFPNLGHVNLDDSFAESLPVLTGEEDRKSFDCQICRTMVAYGSVDAHAKSHVAKQYKCGYCALKSFSEEKAQAHCRSVHAGAPIKIIFNGSGDQDAGQLSSMKAKCFPEIAAEMGSFRFGMSPSPNRSSRLANLEPTKLVCQVCDQVLASNSNSMDVHVKNHLNFKPHHCGYCEYRSCIPGKVKRHVDTVHRGKAPKILAEAHGSNAVKTIIQHLKAACFPNQFAIEEGTDPMPKDKAARLSLVAKLKSELDQELRALASGGKRLSEDLSAGGGDMENTFGIDGMPPAGKLTCSLCASFVNDNPNSVGMHVRIHMDYKPFGCTLCSYKSGIQSKVKRHIRGMHKCEPLDSLVLYTPQPDVRQEAAAMRGKCFPKLAEAAELVIMHEDSMGMGDMDDESSTFTDDEESFRPESSMDDGSLELTCELCWESLHLPDDTHAARMDAADSHAAQHLTLDHYQCGVCAFIHQTSDVVKEHLANIHVGASGDIVFLPANPDAPIAEFREKCFGRSLASFDDSASQPVSELERGDNPTPIPNGGADSDPDGLLLDEEDDSSYAPDEPLPVAVTPTSSGRKQPLSNRGAPKDLTAARYKCQLCDQRVSQYASSLYIHVKNHMNYKPYACSECQYRSPVKSKVHRHVRNSHKDNVEAHIKYDHKPGIEREIALWKSRCFPCVPPSAPQFANGKIPCGVCAVEVADTPLSRTIHAKNHLGAKPFHCPYCNYKSCQRGEARRHITRAHKGKAIHVVHEPEQAADATTVKAMITQCFGSAPDPSSGDLLTSDLDMMDEGSNLEVEDDEMGDDQETDVGGHSSDTGTLGEDEEKVGADFNRNLLFLGNENYAAPSPLSDSGGSGLRTPNRRSHCLYCSFEAASKYSVKQHCLSEHPGLPVDAYSD